MKESIFTALIDGYKRWQNCSSIRKTENYLFVILIASSRSLLFAFDENASMVHLMKILILAFHLMLILLLQNVDNSFRFTSSFLYVWQYYSSG